MVEILKVVSTDTVKILSTMVEMVEILKVVITDTVKVLSTMVEMVEILKSPIKDNLSTNWYVITLEEANCTC